MTPTQAMARRAGEGEARWWFGGLAEIKATAEDTDGQLTIVEVTEPPGMEAPLHVHHREDEGFYVLEGSATFVVGDGTVEAGPGTFLYGPRDVPHRFDAGPEGVRLLYLFVPGGFEDFIRETAVPAPAATLPPPNVVPDPGRVGAALPRYGAELVGEDPS